MGFLKDRGTLPTLCMTPALATAAAGMRRCQCGGKGKLLLLLSLQLSTWSDHTGHSTLSTLENAVLLMHESCIN